VSEEIQQHTGPHLKLQQTSRNDMVFILPPGISDCAFQLRIDNTWFCNVLLLFAIDTKTDAGMRTHKCAYVSVLVEEYKGHRRPGHILHILYWHIMHILCMTLFIAAQLGWMSASPPLYSSAVNQHKSCM
jgi:hypothetical protein